MRTRPIKFSPSLATPPDKTIIFGLKIEMRKKLYELIDESNNKIELNKLIGKKRKETLSLSQVQLLNECTKKKLY